ncbi:hypothetical protein C7N43_38810 [Sphingobacteriales bacterium UPWRP_1]|nr:hypothetical protein C7N43_38810 [Sphingobacteriales bacterium UPWRP_1]
MLVLVLFSVFNVHCKETIGLAVLPNFLRFLRLNRGFFEAELVFWGFNRGIYRFIGNYFLWGGRVGISYYKPKTLSQQNCLLFSYRIGATQKKIDKQGN